MPKPLIMGLSCEDAERLSVLVVEDNEHMRRVICEFLFVLRIRTIREASDGAEALEILRGFRPDLIFVDWRMERIDGFELVKRVRAGADAINPYVPIIMVTGYADGARVKAARDAGVSDLLVKPVSLTALAQRVETIFNEPRPFIKTPGYVGPDRRRRMLPFIGADRRKVQHGLITLQEIQSWPHDHEFSDAV